MRPTKDEFIVGGVWDQHRGAVDPIDGQPPPPQRLSRRASPAPGGLCEQDRQWFAAHDQIEIAQADVEVDYRRLVPALGARTQAELAGCFRKLRRYGSLPNARSTSRRCSCTSLKSFCAPSRASWSFL